MTGMNNVTSATSTMASIGPIGGWIITAGIFIAVLVIIFLLSKNFRQFIYGGVISGILLINFKLSRYVGKSTTENNFEPIKWVGYIVGFILLAISLGHLFLKTKWGKNLEKKLK